MRDNRLSILHGDCREVLRTLPDESVHCCVTSPPYWGLRDYGVEGQLGLERTPEEYVARMVDVFREVRRVLRKDGTAWVNLGDSYNAYNGNAGPGSGFSRGVACDTERPHLESGHGLRTKGLKPKDLVGIPWRVAFALQADGWYLRQDIIWHKPNPMPESVTDRCTKAHEYVFLLSKSERYYYDAEAVIEPAIKTGTPKHLAGGNGTRAGTREGLKGEYNPNSGRNKRSVWKVPTAPFSEAHFATFPPDLIKPCILAGTSARGCCPKCGAPWARMVQSEKRIPVDYDGKNASQDPNFSGRRMLANVRAARLNGAEHDNPFPPKQTIGWQPTCECGESHTVPGTVLDPFGGSGTTGMVSVELGRRAILIELNPEYADMALRRCDITPGLALA